MSVNINDLIKKAEAEYGLGKGEYFKLQEGDNKLRILSSFEPHQSVYNGKPNFKFVAWILDRRDGKIKPFFMSKTIAEYIGALQDNPDYTFDDFPMPYDITINAKGAGTKEVVYTVLAARNNTALTTEENNALIEKMPIAEFVQKLKDRDAEQGKAPQKPQSTVTEPTIEESKPNPFIDDEDEVPFN